MESFMDDLKIESILGLGTKVTMKKVIQAKAIATEKSEEKEEGKIFTTFKI